METEDEIRIKKLIPSLDIGDKERLNFLYCPFRPRELNPVGYDEKLRFWCGAVEGICALQNSSIFSLESLKDDLRIYDKSPHGLQEVVSELRRTNKIVPLWNDGSWSSWAMDLAHSRIFNIKGHDSFLHVATLNKFMDDIKKYVKDNTELSINGWSYTRLKPPLSHREDLEPCLKRLVSSGNIMIIKMENSEEFIRCFSNNKLIQPEESEEKAIINLLLASEKIKVRLKELEEKEQSALVKTKEFLQKGQRDRAKNQLLKTKKIRKNLIENDNVLDKVENLLECFNASNSHKEVIKSLKTGNDVIKNHLLNVDDVEEIMDQVQETLQISSELSESIASSENVDESLLAELEELEKEDAESKDSDLADAMSMLKIPDNPLKLSNNNQSKKTAQLV
ncbi:uncharacterized protein [Lepeophtheirus salmonis]|uniref:uncharacterized protein n=1 Tax=Lepeophtheirus salmonis TaxID=72036 RepID=UPI001AE231E5|nr:uncharacterized protein LOC121123963 [Lepeophtheirus salmonis]